MGYFANGTEGDLYESFYCCDCIHYDNCAVWDAHMLHNYKECNKSDSILHMLIPRSKDGIGNEKCLMFIEKPPVERKQLVDVIAEDRK